MFTINGLTYPFVRYYNFAAVPDPPRNRRYDMYSALHLARPGDLLFLFQAAPQPPSHDISDRRGIRGVYVVTSRPFRGVGPLRDEISDVGYRIHSRCPNEECGTYHSTGGGSCPRCEERYPEEEIEGETFRGIVLGSQLQVSPLWAFERSVSDERVYGDLSSESLIWTGRFDNAMGAGKGSSIRQLLPEEAVELVRLLATEPEQEVGEPTDHVREPGAPLEHENERSIRLLPTTDRGRVQREDELYFLLTEQLFTRPSPIRQTLSDHLPDDLSWDHLEYAASTFPWGYTASEADYVIFLRNPEGRRLLILIECKPRSAHDQTVLQTLLYAERITQMAFLMAPQSASPERVEILPVVVAGWLKTPRDPDPRVAIPSPFTFEHEYFGGASVRALVRRAVFLEYDPPEVDGDVDEDFRPLEQFTFDRISLENSLEIDWEPHSGAVGTAVERGWILRNTWADARQRASDQMELL